MLDLRAARGERLGCGTQSADGFLAALKHRGGATGDADRPGGAEALRELQLLLDQRSGLGIAAEPLGSQPGLRAPRHHRRVDRQELGQGPPGSQERLEGVRVVTTVGCEPPGRGVPEGGEER